MNRFLCLLFVFTFSTALFGANDKTQANAYDDAWEVQWVAHSRQIYNAGTGKTAGFVLQIGDSITHSNPYGQWPRYGAGKTTEDATLCTWLTAPTWGNGNGDTASKNGFYLAIADTSGGRGMTASSGIATDEYLSGNNNGGGAMPADTNTASAKTKVADSSNYGNNLQIDTVLAAFSDAQFAVLMLGTNDANASRTPAAFSADLTTLVDKIEAKKIVPILSTIPPTTASGAGNIDAYNAAIRSLAQTRGLALIDFNAEILARRSGSSWQNTLIGSDGIHPTASGGGADSSSDPYANGGDAAAHRTGANCENVGYLLRSWLTIQKLKEVKSYIVDGVNPNPPPPPPPPPPTLSSIDLSPANASFPINSTQAFTAIGRDSGGTTLNPQPTFSWSVNGGGTINSNGVLSAAAVPGGPFTVSVSSGGKSAATSFTLFRPNASPLMTSLPTATPNPAGVNASITFTAFAADADGDPLTYTWDFAGTGSAGGASAQHAFTAPGEYLVSVIATDPFGASATNVVLVTVLAPSRFDIDTDGDGFSDGAEDAAGTNANDPLSFPGSLADADGDGIPDGMDSDDDNDGVSDSLEIAQGTDPWNAASYKRYTLVVQKLSGRVQNLGKDTITLSGVLTGLPPGFKSANLTAILAVGSASLPIPLTAKANGKSANGSLAISLKPVQRNKATKESVFLGGDVRFTAKLQRGTWAAAWGIDLQGASTSLSLPVALKLGELHYAADVPVTTNIRKGKATLKL